MRKTSASTPKSWTDISHYGDRLQIESTLTATEFSDVFKRSGIRRPIDDLPRLQQMIDKADLLITARDGERLVGVARSLTDFCFARYLSDLAVDLDYQHKGIGPFVPLE